MRRAFSLKSSVLVGLALSACLAASCQGNGVTSSCPSLPLYQTYPLGDASIADAESGDSAASQAALARAVDAGCVTAPSSFPSDGDGGMGGAAPIQESDGEPDAGGSGAGAAGHG